MYSWAAPVPPFLEHLEHDQEVLVPIVVIPLSRGNPVTVERTQMELLICLTPLREGGPNSHVQGIHHHQLLAGVGVCDDEHRWEKVLQLAECNFGLGGAAESLQGEGEFGEEDSHLVVVPDEIWW